MAICENEVCKRPYNQEKPWQRFCSSKCREVWRYRQQKFAQVAEAERLLEARAEGAVGTEKLPNSILEALIPERPPMVRRI